MRPQNAPPRTAIKANIDGGARGNPGPAAYGVVVRDAKGEVIAELSDYLGNPDQQLCRILWTACGP